MPTFLSVMRAGRDRDLFLPPEVMARFEQLGEVWSNPEPRNMTGEELAERIPGVQAIIGGWGMPVLDEKVLKHADALKAILYTGGSVAGFVTLELYERGITVISANRLYAHSVAEGTIAYMLCGLRRIAAYDRLLRAGGWPENQTTWSEGLLDAKVGLLGFGQVARYLVPMLKAFNCDISAYDPFLGDDVFAALGVRRVGLEELVRENHILSLHAAKTVDSDHVLSRELLHQMPDGALLVNTARASVVDTDALVDELRSGRIHAVIDVYDEEPLPHDHPLRFLPNATLIPHMAGPTIDRRIKVGHMLVDEWLNILAGGPLSEHAIPKEYGMRMTKEH
nr:hydroxyacid dehydrogenase [bacterium]